MSHLVDLEEYHALYYSDLLYILRSFKKRAVVFGILSALVFLGSLGTSPPLYKAEALFKESCEKKGAASFIETFLPSSLDFSREEIQAIPLMKSKQILKRVVETLGCQMQSEKSRFSSYFQNWAFYFRKEEYLDEPKTFSFSNVSFPLEKAEKYFLLFHSQKSFELMDREGKKVATANVGEEILLPHLRFTLTSCPEGVCLQKKYPIYVVPWLGEVQKIVKNISIVADRNNASFVRLSLSLPNRKVAIAILNQIMKEYERYLQKKNEKMIREQLAYLEKRHEDLSASLEKTLGRQVVYLEKNLGAKGFIALQDETRSYLSLQQSYLQKLSDLDCSINLLQEKGESALGEEVLHLSKKIEELQRQRDPFDLASSKKYKNDASGFLAETDEKKDPAFVCNSFEKKKESTETKVGRLLDLRKKKEETLFVLEELKKETPRIEKAFAFDELQKFLEVWRRPGKSGLKKEDARCYLDHLFHLLSVEETMIQENQLSSALDSECALVDLEGAVQLFHDSSAALENSRLKNGEYSRIQKEFLNPDFDIGSLAALFEDGVTRDLIMKASQLSLRILDEKNYTPKERARFQEEMQVQKAFLSHHIRQVQEKESVRSLMLEEKLRSLQGIIKERLNQEISILEQQKKEFLDKKIEKLQEEKKQILDRLNRLKEEMADLPMKWKKQKELKFATSMGLKVVEKLSESIENKTLQLHLQNSKAGVVDLGYALPKPKIFSFLSSLLMAAAMGVFVAYLIALFQGVVKGFPVSEQRWKALGFLALGRISSLCEDLPASRLRKEDLESLRKIVVAVEGSLALRECCSTISLLSNGGPDYSRALADLISRSGKKVLLIDTGFTESTKNGFSQYLAQEVAECPFEHKERFDLMVSGKTDPHGAEILGSRGFRALIACLKEKYDAILLFNKSSLKNMEPQTLLPLSDFLLLTYEKETLSELKPFTDWANFDNKSRLILIEKKSEV